MTRRQAAAIARPLARTTPWPPLVGAAVVGLPLAGLDGPAGFELYLAATALCVGAGFLLDDDAGDSLAAVPTSLLWRRLLRIVLALPVIAVLWALLVSSAGHAIDDAPTLALAAMLTVTLALAAVTGPLTGDGRGGVAAGPALLIALAVSLLVLPERGSLFPAGPADPLWEQAQLHWTVILAAGALLLVHASRDRGRRRFPFGSAGRPSHFISPGRPSTQGGDP